MTISVIMPALSTNKGASGPWTVLSNLTTLLNGVVNLKPAWLRRKSHLTTLLTPKATEERETCVLSLLSPMRSLSSSKVVRSSFPRNCAKKTLLRGFSKVSKVGPNRGSQSLTWRSL